MRLRVRRYDERGVALPGPVALMSLAAVAMAGIAFLSTDADTEPPAPIAAPVVASPTPAPTPQQEASAQPERKAKPKKPAVRRGGVYVEVYNNSGISGLAGATATKIAGAGWQVVGSDNWYGTIPESTVYYPERLAAEAKLLAKDLGVERLRPAIAPMRFDRLTVILTADFA